MALFIMSSFVLWVKLGIRHGGDTPFYLEGAKRLLVGEPLNGVAAAYSGYMAFLAAHLRFGLGETAVIISQLGLSALAMLAIYDLGRRMLSAAAGAMAASLYALNIDVSRFAYYILSDSLATSVLVLTAYAAFRSCRGSSGIWTALAAILGVAGAMIRLNGWFMVLAIFLYIVLTRPRWARVARYAGCAVVVAAVVFGVVASMARSGTSGGLGPLIYEGRVVWGDAASAIAMPSPGVLGSRGTDVAQYCGQHAASCINLAGHRILVEMAHTRTFYSVKHNAVIWLTFPILYLLALAGVIQMRREPFTWCAVSLVALQMALVAVTGADWDGRFILTVFPLVMLYSAIGAAWIVRPGVATSSSRDAVQVEAMVP